MRYWVYLEGQVVGPYETGEIIAKPWFSRDLQVCVASEDKPGAADWQAVKDNPEFAIRSFVSSPEKELVAPGPPELIADQTLSGTFSEMEKVFRELSARQGQLHQQLIEELGRLKAAMEAEAPVGREAIAECSRQIERAAEALNIQSRAAHEALGKRIEALETALAQLAVLVDLPKTVDTVRQEIANNAQNIARIGNELDLRQKMQNLKEKEAEVKFGRERRQRYRMFLGGAAIAVVLALAAGVWHWANGRAARIVPSRAPAEAKALKAAAVAKEKKAEPPIRRQNRSGAPAALPGVNP
ncbi:MAG: hypothetical protein AAB091_06585 [Elusimicrobiota bacterium]